MSKKKSPITITHKALLQEWDYEKNYLDPENYTCGSGKKVWWLCEKKHSWEAAISKRATMSRGCPYCSGNRVLAGFNDLATSHPQLLQNWDWEKNTTMPTEISRGSNKKIWWKCNNGHSFEASPNRRIKGSGCPYCAGRKVMVGHNDLASTHPDLVREWDYSKNTILPNTVSKGNQKKVWWLCKKGHSWKAQIANRVNGAGCVYCANQSVLVGFNDLASQCSDLVKEWNYKNNTVLPEEVILGSNKKVWWVCSLGHEWETSVNERAGKNRTNCPYCTNSKVLKGYNDFPTTDSWFLEYWSPKNTVSPHDYTAGSGKKVWWRCDEGHDWLASPRELRRGRGCNICASKKVLKGENDFKTLFPDIASEWGTKNVDSPDDFLPFSNKRFWWVCEKGHEWKTSINNRVKRGDGCRICGRSGGEKELGKFVKNLIDEKIVIGNRKIISPYELDIYIPELDIAIEYNGVYWHSEEVIKNRHEMSAREYHEIKINRCREKGVDLLFVWEDDWKNKNEEVKTVLRDYFEHRVPSSLLERLA